MWMTSYIREIQRQLIAVHGFKEDPAQPGIPLDVPDGEYPMTIEGKLDRVRIEDGKISCLNFEEPVSDLRRRDAKQMKPGRTSPLLKTMPITLGDVGKYFVVSVDGQSARIMTGEEFAKIGVDEFDSWSDIGEFDVNQW